MYMMYISGEKLHLCPMPHVSLFSVFTEIRFMLYILWIFCICWTLSLA